jgi:hypothetical protein
MVGMTPEDQALGYVANFVAVALAELTSCLKSNGALHPGQFETALRETITRQGAEHERLDYELLAHLVSLLEGSQPKLN